jgi:hypothetical protein
LSSFNFPLAIMRSSNLGYEPICRLVLRNAHLVTDRGETLRFVGYSETIRKLLFARHPGTMHDGFVGRMCDHPFVRRVSDLPTSSLSRL